MPLPAGFYHVGREEERGKKRMVATKGAFIVKVGVGFSNCFCGSSMPAYFADVICMRSL